jgi:hypothetical protein
MMAPEWREHAHAAIGRGSGIHYPFRRQSLTDEEQGDPHDEIREDQPDRHGVLSSDSRDSARNPFAVGMH